MLHLRYLDVECIWNFLPIIFCFALKTVNVLYVIYSTWNHETETVTSITVMIRILMQSTPILSKNQKLENIN